jgi:hypothetical protein
LVVEEETTVAEVAQEAVVAQELEFVVVAQLPAADIDQEADFAELRNYYSQVAASVQEVRRPLRLLILFLQAIRQVYPHQIQQGLLMRQVAHPYPQQPQVT